MTTIVNVDEYIKYLESEECSRCRERKSISFCDHCRMYDAMMLMYYVPKKLKLDVEPVRHGHWIVDDDGNVFCSECRNSGVNENYCSKCGAKMDGDEE